MALLDCSGRLRKSWNTHSGGRGSAFDTSHPGCICTLPSSESKLNPERDKSLIPALPLGSCVGRRASSQSRRLTHIQGLVTPEQRGLGLLLALQPPRLAGQPAHAALVREALLQQAAQHHVDAPRRPQLQASPAHCESARQGHRLVEQPLAARAAEQVTGRGGRRGVAGHSDPGRAPASSSGRSAFRRAGQRVPQAQAQVVLGLRQPGQHGAEEFGSLLVLARTEVPRRPSLSA